MASIYILANAFESCDVLVELLSRIGHTVSCFTDKLSVLAGLRGRKPDLVLLDARVPQDAGFDVLSTLRTTPRLSRTPVVMYSAEDDPATRSRAKTAGADVYVAKGAGYDVLVRHLRPLLDNLPAT
jgi:DNA-binding response OmpR family regulator